MPTFRFENRIPVSTGDPITDIANLRTTMYELVENLHYMFGNLGTENLGGSLSTYLEDTVAGLGKSLNLQVDVDGIVTEVIEKSAFGELSSKVELTAEGLEKVITRVETVEKSYITGEDVDSILLTSYNITTETATSFARRIGETEGDIDDLSGTVSKQYSEITQSIDGISLSVKTANGTTSVKLADGALDLTGLVTFSDLSTSGKTTINGSNITTGTINAERLDLSGVATIEGLKNGTTTIDGGCITTGTIKAERLELTGVLTIANNAAEAASAAQSAANTAKTNAETAQTAANNAAKTATNFLEYTSAGLDVGNKQSGAWSGFRTRMTSSTFEILDSSENILASYGANTIYLGKNSKNTKIDFCDGLMELSYDTASAAAVLSAANFNIYANGGIVNLGSINEDADGTSYGGYVNLTSVGAGISASTGDSSAVDTYSNIWLAKDGTGYWEATSSVELQAPTINLIGTTTATNSITIDPGSTSYVPFVATRTVSSSKYSADFGVGNPETGVASAMIRLLDSSGTVLNTLYMTDSVCVLNQGYIMASGYRAPRSTGAHMDIMRYNGSTNELFIGRGPYDISAGYTYVYGNSTYINSRGNEYFMAYDGTYGYLYITADTSAGKLLFGPNANGTSYLGGSTRKWQTVYAVNGTINTSDRNLKENISDINSKYEELFDLLRPVTYKLKGSEHERTHIGFIAQEVKESMDKVDLTAKDFAAYCEDVKTELDEEIGEEVEVLDENGEPVKLYSLRYSEFIALNAHMIQKLMRRVTELEKLVS